MLRTIKQLKRRPTSTGTFKNRQRPNVNRAWHVSRPPSWDPRQLATQPVVNQNHPPGEPLHKRRYDSAQADDAALLKPHYWTPSALNASMGWVLRYHGGTLRKIPPGIAPT